MRSRSTLTLASLASLSLLLFCYALQSIAVGQNSVQGSNDEPPARIDTKTAEVSAEMKLRDRARNPKLWRWTKERGHHDSVVGIDVDKSTATGVVVRVNHNVTKANGFECFILTAYHVVEARKSDASIRIDYRNGKSISDCKVVAHDDRHDIALLRTWAPKGVDAATLAAKPVAHKMDLEFAGLGGAADLDESMRHFSGRATQPTNQNFIYADETLLPGDSGGPVFNKDKHLVGIISGGWFWWDAGIKSSQGVPILSTWPARASNLESIQELLDANIPELKVASSNVGDSEGVSSE